MRRTGAMIVAAALIPFLAPTQTSAGTDSSGHPDTCDGAGIAHHVVRAKSLTRRSFDLRRWEDATPVKASEKRKRQDHKLCVERKHKRKVMARFVDDKQDRFQAYRELRVLTPYDCGSAGFFAIPCYIIACESGFSWSAYNPSGASGPYQLLGWGAPMPADTFAAQLEHHRIAASLWAGGAGASHWVCA